MAIHQTLASAIMRRCINCKSIYKPCYVNVIYKHRTVNLLYSPWFVLTQKLITEEIVSYPIKTLSQMPLILKGFRKEHGLTQAAMAEKLGITQQSYAYFEANPATTTFDRLFRVLRILGVEISLNQAVSVTSLSRLSSAVAKNVTAVKTSNQKIRKTASAETIKKKKSSAVIKPSRIISNRQKKESW